MDSVRKLAVVLRLSNFPCPLNRSLKILHARRCISRSGGSNRHVILLLTYFSFSFPLTQDVFVADVDHYVGLALEVQAPQCAAAKM